MNPAVLVIILLVLQLNGCICDYWKERQLLEAEEKLLTLGSSIVLTEYEEIANEILMKAKSAEYTEGLKNATKFLPSQHFFRSKKDIEKSEVFKFIQQLPKGANLHTHDTALVSNDYLFNLTYWKDLYACSFNGRLQLQFFNSSFVNTTCDWVLLEQLRERNSSVNEWIKSQITLVVENPEEYESEDEIWSIFQDIFWTVLPFLTYRPVFEDYFYRALEELYEDNVLYLEFRGMLPEVYDLNGRVYDPLEVAEIYIDVLEKFKEDHEDFIGARLIYAPMRHVSNDTMWDYVTLARSLKQEFPNFMAGFDLVGEEKEGYALKNFVQQIQNITSEMKVFFHAGETKWYGTGIDGNLIDAILLNTSRIGHGFALYKHPKVLQAVKEKNIAIEVNPISNQVLTYVDDLRNHPATFLIANNYSVVIANDDPSFWGAKGLSYDWYMAFMGLASRNADLRLLKQLAINSLKYSSFSSDSEREAAFKLWSEKWDNFIQKVIEESLDIPSIVLLE